MGVERSALAKAVEGASLASLCTSLSRRELLVSSVIAAKVLSELGMSQGDRIVLLLPNTIEHRVWVQVGGTQMLYDESLV